jgi:uncharacterized protein (TIGR03503 family)
MKSRISILIFAAFAFNLLLSTALPLIDGLNLGSTSTSYAESKKRLTREERREQRRNRATASSESKTKSIPKHLLKEEEKVDNKSFDEELAKDSGLDTLLILDSSGSMRRTDPNRLRDQGAKLFIRFLGEGDRVAIFQFDREAKKVLDFTQINAAKIPVIDAAIGQVGVTGTHTNIETPLKQALDFLKTNGRKDVVKSIILLSDGKMDPHPESGSAEDLTKKLFSEDLRQLRRIGVKVYTLSFSEEADQELLGKIADETNAIHWFAPDVNTIHKKFSEMFLALKNPQVLLPEGSGYEVDASANEITFYISRNSKEQNISIINPLGAEITNRDIPAGVKWFKGELFDIITIANPMPGFWGIEGVEPSDGFATLLSDIKLQVKWPSSTLMVGDSVRLVARLTEEGKPIDRAELKDLIFYNYQVINKENGERVLKGSLIDNGTEGDETAGDGLYSTVIKIDKEGDYQLVVNVTAPTFTRHQVLPLPVSKGFIFLSSEKREVEHKEETFFVINLGSAAMELDHLNLMLLAKKVGSEELIELPLEPVTKAKDHYEVSAKTLPQGGFAIEARLSGTNSHGSAIKAASETIHYVTEETVAGDLHDEHTKETDSEPSNIPEILSSVLTALWAVGLALFIRKKYPPQPKVANSPEAYIPPAEYKTKLEKIKANLSTERREPTNHELELFAVLGSEAFGADANTIAAAKNDAQAKDLDKPADEKELEEKAEASKTDADDKTSEQTEEQVKVEETKDQQQATESTENSEEVEQKSDASEESTEKIAPDEAAKESTEETAETEVTTTEGEPETAAKVSKEEPKKDQEPA